MALSNLTGNIPFWEGQGLCDGFYGDLRDRRRDCARAISLLERGNEPVPFAVNPATGPLTLPMDVKSGDCMIQIEAAGPELPEFFNIVPNRIIAMANWLLATCVQGSRPPTGGFITSDMTPLEEYIVAPNINLDRVYPRSTAFFTVTMTSLVPDWISPGNFEPDMARLLSRVALDASKSARSPLYNQDLIRRSQRFFEMVRQMHPRGFRRPWWVKPERMSSNKKNITATLELPGGTSEAATARRRKAV